MAVGSLKEPSHVEIHDLQANKLVSTLKKHSDMIDSLLKLEFPCDKSKTINPYINWLLSASRDRTIVLWKLFEGKPMKREVINLSNSIQSHRSLATNRRHKKSLEIG